MKRIIIVILVILVGFLFIKTNKYQLTVNNQIYFSYKIFTNKTITFLDNEGNREKHKINIKINDLTNLINSSSLIDRYFLDSGRGFSLESNKTLLVMKFASVPVLRTNSKEHSIMTGIEIVDDNTFYMYEYAPGLVSNKAMYRLVFKTDDIMIADLIDEKSKYK